MKAVIEGIVKALVDNPDEVRIVETKGESIKIVEINVASNDISKIIGKQGNIANSIRNLAKAIAGKNKERIMVEIIQNKQ